ncbi:MAG: GntR family transcriptional regulator [Actinomycetota bacterium]
MGQRDSITDELRADILEGHFRPGDRLVELRLTDQYDCGRMAVRTAIVELAAEGLVDREVNRGAKVRDVAIDEAIQITEARRALEGLIAEGAAINADDVQREVLESIGRDMQAAVEAGDRGAYSALNGALHGVIRDASGHDVAAKLVRQLRNRGAQHRFRLATLPGRVEDSLAQHLAIIEAVVSGDAAAARSTMEAHLASVVEVLQSWPES